MSNNGLATLAALARIDPSVVFPGYPKSLQPLIKEAPMSKRIFSVLSLVLVFLMAETVPAQAQSSDAKALLEEAAKAMGGMQALRSLKNEVVESEGKQFEHAQAKQPVARAGRRRTSATP
jgi:hypothetical protein